MAMTTDSLPRLLLVDDEVSILDGLRRHLRGAYDVCTATGADDALALMAAARPFAAVVSDMRMPGKNGAVFLAEVRRRAPDTVRLLLTGQSDTESAISAINDGQIFRFLTKPCPPETLRSTLADAVELHRLMTAEKELLEKTLRSSVQALVDVLALAQPEAFSRAVRISETVGDLSAAMTGGRDWEVEVTGMLAQVGAVTLPGQVLQKLDAGLPLSPDEREMLDRVPSVSRGLLANIPRLEGVAAAIGQQQLRYDGVGRDLGSPAGDAIPLAARILRFAMDFDTLCSQHVPAPIALDRLREDAGAYDPAVIDAWQCLQQERAASADVPVEVQLADLRPGMVLLEDVVNGTGTLLLGRGGVVTDAVLRRLENHDRLTGLRGALIISMRSRER